MRCTSKLDKIPNNVILLCMYFKLLKYVGSYEEHLSCPVFLVEWPYTICSNQSCCGNLRGFNQLIKLITLSANSPSSSNL